MINHKKIRLKDFGNMVLLVWLGILGWQKYLAYLEAIPLRQLRSLKGFSDPFKINENLVKANFTNKQYAKKSHSLLTTYYKTEIPSLTNIFLIVVLNNLVKKNFAYHDFFREPKIALTKQGVGVAQTYFTIIFTKMHQAPTRD